MVICYFAGLRPGNAELFGLTWDDVDGGDLKATSQLLGHATPAQTVSTCQHVNTAMHKANISRPP